MPRAHMLPAQIAREAILDRLNEAEARDEGRREYAAETLALECWWAKAFDLQHPLNREVRS